MRRQAITVPAARESWYVADWHLRHSTHTHRDCISRIRGRSSAIGIRIAVVTLIGVGYTSAKSRRKSVCHISIAATIQYATPHTWQTVGFRLQAFRKLYMALYGDRKLRCSGNGQTRVPSRAHAKDVPSGRSWTTDPSALVRITLPSGAKDVVSLPLKTVVVPIRGHHRLLGNGSRPVCR